MNRLLILISVLALSGCSSMSFTRSEKPFDGTVHATSALICSVYWSNHGFDGKDKGRTTTQRILPSMGLIVYGGVDLVATVVSDIIVWPVHAAGGGPPVASFDQVPHAILPCGMIEHSKNVVLGL